MKVLHLPDTFLPYYTGGKEVFTFTLAEALTHMGIENIVLIHRNNRIPSSINEYIFQGIQVIVLEPLTIPPQYYWTKESLVNDQFREFLSKEKPDIIHFHDQSGGASISHLRIAKKLGFKTVLTYHSPGQSCPQHALLYKAKYLCDGYISEHRCATCLLTQKKIPFPLNHIMALSGVSNIAKKLILFRQLDYYSKIQEFKQAFCETYHLHDAIHVFAHWVKDVLLLNQVPAHKIFYSRQGIPLCLPTKVSNHIHRSDSKLKLLFTGRCTEIKGVHVLIAAVKMLPCSVPVEVHFLGPYWNDTQYGNKMLKQIANDQRFLPPKLVKPNEVKAYMQQMDACIIPSLWPETGPLVMLEALENNLPVIASNFSGMAEVILHGKNGLLFERANAKDLAKCIIELYERKKAGKKFEISQVRDVKELAQEILSLYNQLCHE